MKTLKASLTPLYLNNMIDIEYTSKQVDTTSFTDNPPRPVLFLGFVIKNEYDNLRIKLNEKYNPKKFIIFINDGKGTPSGMIPLYGIALTPNDNIKKLIHSLPVNIPVLSYDIKVEEIAELLQKKALILNPD